MARERFEEHAMPHSPGARKRRVIRQTIAEMRSPESPVRLKAIARVRARGWFHDGSLEGANLRGVNLRGEDLSEARLQGAVLAGATLISVSLVRADLRGVCLWDPEWGNAALTLIEMATGMAGADLRGADFTGADIRGAVLSGSNLSDVRGLTNGQLARVLALSGATMPDGSRYDGRFVLPWDMRVLAFDRVDRLDPNAVASWYGVSHEAYQRGLAWARENLPVRPLIWEMGSRDNSAALRAVEALRADGWLGDGSLQGVWFDEANLEGADLHDASLPQAHLAGANLARANLSNADLQEVQLAFAFLTEADLTGANLRSAIVHAHLSKAILVRANLQGAFLGMADLRGADLTGASLVGATLEGARLRNVTGLGDRQLAQVSELFHATMPDGQRYDGRYALPGDLKWAQQKGVDTENPAAMAESYGVPLDRYLQGQEWARSHLSEMRGEEDNSAG